MNVETQMESLPCPKCGHPMPVDPSFPVWCDACNHNVLPEPEAKSKNRMGLMDRVALKLGEKRSKQIFDHYCTLRDLKPHLHFSKLLGMGMALLLVLFPVALVVGGLLLLITWNVGFMFVAALLFMLAYKTIPQPAPMPLMLLDPQSTPTLHRICQQVAAQLGARLEGVALDWHHNASMGRYTHRRTPVMTLGLPLMANLSPEEKLAIIAHEMAHQANGDFSRSFMFQWACNILGILMYPLPAAWMEAPLWGYYRVMASCLYEDSQRAEYFADDAAASIAGTQSTISVLRKMHLGTVYYRFLEHTIRNRNRWDVFLAFKEHVSHIPAREGERLRRAEMMEGYRLQSTHPPTAYRIQRLQAFDKPAAALFTPEELQQMEKELLECHSGVQEAMMSLYRDVVY
ncbi:M48 family metallopeptidase [Deinococcus misasensis]|uniref:M48 family metallopeptidase n=1 Tax=Deinococcus misasensis TaxID=392413 RepID=UPI000553EB0C|nr:M48 family metallopeptidase [Deinococcus misasensis]